MYLLQGSSGQMSDEHKVRTEVDRVVYQGRQSVHMSRGRVWIDDQEVGVEVDHDGNPLENALPHVELPEAVDLTETLRRRSWWQRLFGWSARLGKAK